MQVSCAAHLLTCVAAQASPDHLHRHFPILQAGRELQQAQAGMKPSGGSTWVVQGLRPCTEGLVAQQCRCAAWQQACATAFSLCAMQTGRQVLADWQAGASRHTHRQESLDCLTVHQLAVGHGYLQAAQAVQQLGRWAATQLLGTRAVES